MRILHTLNWVQFADIEKACINFYNKGINNEIYN